jgi:hypothetical protein
MPKLPKLPDPLRTTKRRMSGMPKMPTIGSLGSSDYKGPTGRGDDEIVDRVRQAMEACRPVSLVYWSEDGDRHMVVSPAAMTTVDGSTRVFGMAAPRVDGPEPNRPRYRCLYAAGLREAEIVEGDWTPVPGDPATANCLKGGVATTYARCPKGREP